MPRLVVSHCAFKSSTLAAVEIPEAAGASLKVCFFVTIAEVSALVSSAF